MTSRDKKKRHQKKGNQKKGDPQRSWRNDTTPFSKSTSTKNGLHQLSELMKQLIKVEKWSESKKKYRKLRVIMQKIINVFLKFPGNSHCGDCQILCFPKHCLVDQGGVVCEACVKHHHVLGTRVEC